MEEISELLNRPAELFSIADELRRKRNGDVVTYVINRNINYTNICVGDCKFCAFRQRKGYVLSIEEILRKIDEAYEWGATEVCIQGGLHPNMHIEHLCKMLGCIKDEHSEIHIHAFSPMEIYHTAKNSEMDIRDALKELRSSGLDSMPGTAAEILDDDIRELICPHKLSVLEWESIVKTAHRLGIPTTATMMYGHVESMEHRIKHMLRIKRIQKETKGFTEFVLLPFMPENNKLSDKYSRTMMEDMITHALSRIILDDEIANIQASWPKLGPELTRKLLPYVNDVGGTLMEENISRAAGGVYGEYMAPAELEKLIIDAGRNPKQRNTLYNIIG